jgi:flagellar hook-associated protein 1 FlgK
LAVQDIPLSSGKSPVQSYASLVFAVGNYTSNAQAESDATATSLQQLNNQQGAVSGVSINEEATNMLRYQQGFEAAARVISTINQMITVALNLGNSQTF